MTHNDHVPRPRLSSLIAVCALAAACAAPTAKAPPTVHANAVPMWGATVPQRPAKVLIVVEENKTPRAALAGMPYLAALASTYGKTTAYKAISHPSLPNYLAIAGGSTFGVRDDFGPARHRLTGPSVFDRVIAGGRTAKTYAEAMPSRCALTSTAKYAVKHNPWAYFVDERSACDRYDVPLTALAADARTGNLPNAGMVVANMCHIAHDCPLGTADAWLRHHVGPVLIRSGLHPEPADQHR